MRFLAFDMYDTFNPFDVVGAKAAGMQVAWVNRRGEVLDKVGGRPDIVTSNLVTLAQELK